MDLNIIQKVCLVGDPGVGKTSLVRRFVLDQFNDRYITTVGTKVTKKKMKLTLQDGAIKAEVILMIWDVAGQKKTLQTKQMYFRGSKGALVVCDLTRHETLEGLKSIISDVQGETGNIPIIVMANKADLVDEIKYGVQDIRDCLGEVKIFITSAKTGVNVEEAFAGIGEDIVQIVLDGNEEGP